MRAPEPGAPVRVASIVARSTLFETLSSGLTGGITLVSAPPGSGKTVLLRSWVDAAGLRDRTAWVSVERDGRDPQGFWLAVVAALRVAAGAHGTIEELAPTPAFDGAAVVERITTGAASLDAPVLLVIDDLHQLVGPGALAQLELFLALRPPELRVILATRHDPSIGLHRFRLAGELTEIRASDLRFGLDETRALLAAAGISLSDAAVARLHSRTEGWAAGLRLAAISMAAHEDPERFVADFSGSERTVADYLFAEVLERQAEPVRRLLLRTSILERVTGSLADRLLDASGSERVLLALEDAGAFVVSVDRARTTFRYHQLFADLLRLELRRTEPDAIPGLHRAAAAWYAEHGSAVDAIKHAQAATDWQHAAALLGQHGFSLALDGSFATIRALLDRFPPDALADPELAAFLAYGEVIRPALDTGAAYIEVAERHASEVPEERRRAFEAMLATTRLTLARWRGDYRAALSDVRPMLEPVQAETVSEVTAANDVRAVALMNLGIVELWAGAGDDAERHLGESLELARRNGRPYVEQGCLAHLAAAAGRRSLTALSEHAGKALEILDRFGWTSEPIVPLVLALMGSADAWQGRFDDAEPWIARAEQALGPDAEPAKALLVRWSRGVQRLGQGDFARALEAFAEAGRIHSQTVSPNPLGIQARGLRVQTLVRMGRLPEARAVLATAASDEERDHSETRAASAAIHLAEGDARGAIEVLAPVLAGSALVVRDVSVINALILDALARDMLGEPRVAEADVERALELAEPDALILPFLVTPARELLERHPRHRTAHASLLANILDVISGSALHAERGDRPDLLEALTDSELRVLRYLPSHLSAPEIATEMFLSTSTVKTHMRHIYEKLGAHHRNEAVERARQLGLLGPSGRSRR